MSEPLSHSYPVLPLRDIVVFPHMIVPLFVGREKSVRALEEVMADDKQILLSSQIDPTVDDPTADGIYRVGRAGQCAAAAEAARRHREGAGRRQDAGAASPNSSPNDRFFEARAVDAGRNARRRDLGRGADPRRGARNSSATPRSRRTSPKRRCRPCRTPASLHELADLVAGHLGIEVAQKQELLETLDVAERLEKVYGQMQGEMSVLQVEKKIKTRVKTPDGADPARVLSE